MVQSTFIYTFFAAAVGAASPLVNNTDGSLVVSDQPTRTVSIVPSMRTSFAQDQNEQCTRRLATVINTVTVTMPPPPGMSGETNFSYMTLNPTETNSVVSTDKGTETVIRSSTAITGNTQTTNSNALETEPVTATPEASATTNPTDDVPVSRAGDTLNPSAAAEANEFDKTAVRAIESVNIRAPDGRCLVIDPTAGDFRQNLIPVQLTTCSEDVTQKFDIVTKGEHNDAKAGDALLVSVLTNGCLSFDARRPEGDTVTMFSCGGRADGGEF